MRLLPISMVESGMRLAKRIYNSEGLPLLMEEVELTQTMIRRLTDLGVDFVYIDDPRTRDITVKDAISEETRIRAVSEIRSSFRQMMGDQIKRTSITGLQLGKAFRGVMDMILNDMTSHKDSMIMLTNISAMDDYLFQHSLNVCIYSTMLGMAHDYTRDELMTLGIGALLHDIGKTQIPLELLRKKEPLTDKEFDLIKQHTVYGFQFLKDEPNIPLLAAHCALQHHERMDGSGYPRRLKGTEIHEYARLIGVVDSYDAMTTHRVYRNAMLPHQALEIIFAGSGTLYETQKVELFRDKIAIYPIGITVTLNTGEKGVVVDLNSKAPHRPVVRLLYDAEGQELKDTPEIDLSKALSVMVVGVNEKALDPDSGSKARA
ncbi:MULTISPECIES: HD-GYP domain-containing protein [unclassified Paenibacillus]|uniref:HD-GYP domain-containing protein n=1 Tax=unclassified Paenibacillus TaxID=185978 RepID=UPI001AE853A2|nr:MULTISPECIES: HD-GYP domain-containing protein [unclassified Paenibacillus]MBP1154568.1 HD-GYP domain-containing protein (c-di-GMP phosphodiesterase class II) [Paenibacillus sp. PvP091]MBP1170048.1 HD-GYP domain-containing protein (c-di-GMP phosphodiesterase class II) [Paenibacillus sp. PvR098]MBP2441076.1 HD-GYP domain-containing protein (c-di-GMP phosphodiesterase class II) [Paenibacillus sp. PvP052]